MPVLTADNAQEFYAEKLGLNAKPQDPPKEEATAEPKAEPKEEGEEKSKSRFAERLSELADQRRTAQEEARRERERAEKLEREKAELEARLAPPDQGKEPKRADFETDQAYWDAMIDWRADQRIAKRDAEARERAEALERQKIVKAWTANVEKTRGEIEDYDEAISDSTVSLPNHVRDAVIESDVGPKLLYHFAKNPEDAERIAGMRPASALRELGKIEAKLTAKGESKPETKLADVAPKLPKAEVKAEPITPLRGASSSADVPVTSDGKFTGSFAEYKAARKAGRLK